MDITPQIFTIKTCKKIGCFLFFLNKCLLAKSNCFFQSILADLLEVVLVIPLYTKYIDVVLYLQVWNMLLTLNSSNSSTFHIPTSLSRFYQQAEVATEIVL